MKLCIDLPLTDTHNKIVWLCKEYEEGRLSSSKLREAMLTSVNEATLEDVQALSLSFLTLHLLACGLEFQPSEIFVHSVQ